MKVYEGFFVFAPEATTDARKNQIKMIEDLVAKFKGKVVQKVEWGKRPLGYPVKKFREGYIIIVDFQLESVKEPELSRAIRLQEEVLKFMITAKNLKAEKKIAAQKLEEAKAPAKPPVAPAASAHPAVTR